MQATIPTPELKKALTVLTDRRLGRNYGPPVLDCIRVDVGDGILKLTRTDLDTWATVAIGCIDASFPGSALVRADQLKKATPAGKGSTTLVDLAGTVRASFHDGTSSELRAPVSIEEWPKRKDAPVVEHSIGAGPVLDVLGAASSDMARPILTGVLFDGRRVVATDSYRLHIGERPQTEPELDALVPAGVLHLAAKAKADTFGIGIGDGHVTLTAGPWTFTSMLIEGEFPPYERLIPTTMAVAIDLTHAVDAIAACKRSSRRGEPVRITVQDDSLHLQGGADNTVTATVPKGATSVGEGYRIGLNPLYLLDAMAGCSTTLEVTDPLKPVRLGSADQIRVLMPVRIS